MGSSNYFLSPLLFSVFRPPFRRVCGPKKIFKWVVLVLHFRPIFLQMDFCCNSRFLVKIQERNGHSYLVFVLLFSFCVDVSTDGKWCYLVFWVVGRPTRWDLLKNRLLEVCPMFSPAASEIYYYRPEFQQPKPQDVFLLKFWCYFDRKGLLHGTPSLVL